MPCVSLEELNKLDCSNMFEGGLVGDQSILEEIFLKHESHPDLPILYNKIYWLHIHIPRTTTKTYKMNNV